MMSRFFAMTLIQCAEILRTSLMTSPPKPWPWCQGGPLDNKFDSSVIFGKTWVRNRAGWTGMASSLVSSVLQTKICATRLLVK